MNAAAGSDEAFVAKYSFRADLEGFRIETVTVVNDVVGSKLGDHVQGTLAIKNVILNYRQRRFTSHRKTFARL